MNPDVDALTLLKTVREDVKASVDNHTTNATNATTQRDSLLKQSQDQDAQASRENAAAAEHQSILDKIDDVLSRLQAANPTTTPTPTQPTTQPANPAVTPSPVVSPTENPATNPPVNPVNPALPPNLLPPPTS